MGHDFLGILVVNGAIGAFAWILSRFKPFPPTKYHSGMYCVLLPTGIAAWSGGPEEWFFAAIVCLGVVLLHFGWPAREAVAAEGASHPGREAPVAR